MLFAIREQRNPYKGSPARAFLRIEVVALDGSLIEFEVLADTGSPSSIIVTSNVMRRSKRRTAPDVHTNFGVLEGGWLQLRIPSIGFDVLVLGYSSDRAAIATENSSPDFQGLVGLPLLRQMEYGGDSSSFWVRDATKGP